jgi:uncharacterized damage-inducible protein DinB
LSRGAIATARYYEPWAVYNERIVEVVGEMSAEQLALRPDPERWPIWATVGHMCGARVYWLCGVFGEPGAETTPFPDPHAELGWEDDLDTPRGAAELTEALESTWRIVAGCLERWTASILFEDYPPQAGKKTQIHTRQAVLVRLLSHDSYHAGELSQTLGIHGLTQIDLWRPPD